MPNNLIQMPWKELGTLTATEAAADGALAVGERTYLAAYALRATNCVIWTPIPLHLDMLLFRFRGKTNGENHTIDVHMGRLGKAANTDLNRICTLDVEIGTQVNWNGATNYTLFADECTLSNNTAQWPTAAAVYQSGNDTELMVELAIAPCGCDLIVFHGHSTFPNNLKIDGTGYS